VDIVSVALILAAVVAAFAGGVLAGAWWREAPAYRLVLVRLANFNIINARK
jgi:hypothetical protein